MDLKTNGMLASYDFSEVGITDGLVGWWPLNGNANDITVNGNDGTVSGATVASGLDQLCYSFDGVDDWIQLDNSNFPYGASPGSLSAWAMTTTTAAGYRWIVAYGTAANKQSRFLGINGTTFYVGGYGTTATEDVIYSGVPLNTWFHMVGTYDGTNVKMYIDGILVASGDRVWNTVESVARIGQQTNTANEFWQGEIQDVRIYNRALSAEEVKIQYELTKNKVMNIDSTGKLYTAGKIIETY